ncbi:MAG: PQQ-dependent sugar dehydrogenase [Solirubrobacterales bacterium]
MRASIAGHCATAALAAALAGLLFALAPSGADARVKLKRIGRFHSPVYVTVAPDVPGLFVVEQPGRVRLVQGKRRRTFLNIAGQVISGGEQGLLSIAFPPDFASRLFYAYFTNKAGDNEIDEFQASSDSTRVLPGSQRQVLLIPHPVNTNHNGGQLQFGPDGFLYIGTGDGGGSGDRPDNAQNTNTLLGKILRIDPRAQGGQPYGSPASNPFAAGAGRDEVYAYGLRNPFRFSFDLLSKPGEPRIAIGDVGQDRFEEIDYETLAGARGANFGWNDFEGFAPFDGAHPPTPAALRPIKVYSLGGGACALIGGYVVSDQRLRSLLGRYVYGDFCIGKLRSLIPSLGGSRRDRRVGARVPMLSSFGEGRNGSLFATSLNGPVFRLLPARGRR